MNKLPQEILNIKQWSHSYSVGELKRPRHSHYLHNGSLTYDQAKIKAGKFLLMGFYVTEDDPYLLGDVDHVPDPMDKKSTAMALPIELADLLMNHKLYSEVSPSGKGIRFIAKLPSVADKKLLEGRYYKNRVVMDLDEESGLRREAQIHIGRPWNTITGNRTPYSSDVVSTLTLEQIGEVFKLRYKGDAVSRTGHVPPPKEHEGQLPVMSEIKKALDYLPFDRNPRIRRAFKLVFNEEFTPYEYWLKVCMALADYAAKTSIDSDKNQALDYLIQWSRTDKEGFTGEADVCNKWTAVQKTGDATITYHTLLALAHYSRLRWPVPKVLTKAQKEAGITENNPLTSEYVNFAAMIEYYDLRLYRDANASQKMYLTGDADIIKRYFTHLDVKVYHDEYYGAWTEKTLVGKLHSMCQEIGFIGISHTQVRQNIINWIGDITRTVDMVKLYFDTPYDKLCKSYKSDDKHISLSTVDYMFESLTLDFLTGDHVAEERLYRKYYKSWLMGLARNVFMPDSEHMNNCVLILTGAEQIRKTTHFKRMLPEFMREDRIAFTTHGFGTETAVRDVTKLAASNNLVVWDEVEQYLSAETESNFKKLIDNNPVKIIDKYEVIESYVRPIAIYGATSNQRTFKLSDNGSRRLFVIPIQWCDTDRLNKISWWHIINDLRDLIEQAPKSKPPWLLSEGELEYQSLLHGRITSKTGLDIILEEMFDFSLPFPIVVGEEKIEDFDFYKNPQFWTLQKISSQIQTHLNGHHKFGRPEMVNTLKRLCGRWSNTNRKPRQFSSPKVYLDKGEIVYNGRSKFWLPSLRI